MVHLSARHFGTDAARGESRAAWLYKDDRPRNIDRFIDFFGDHLGGTGDGEGDTDRCGEVLLQSLA
jgi:hypothetical protein